ncbi:transcriptional adapter 2-alpha [Cladophialophora psammophila CBS 110553]|uniref:Transcriptional adapter 2-alpha n=1 Tax=Cladophialophora psammophila CBS 110553 TaxID=1182543 RepID=W9WRI9_9EURO|nr:transcriptional adapter 2-alpha [Cladophialophora psammophila CBS 110553]EXJ70822.1 transcriptional adapter 2-alpha [Cladophialophora psammophila CBS 110553]
MDDTQPQPAELKHESSDAVDLGANGADVVGADAAETQSRDAQSSANPNGTTPANPLDAPKSPPAQDDPDGEQEDAEMGGVDEDAKVEDVDAEKDGAEESQETPAATQATDGQAAQAKSSLEAAANSHLVAQTHQIILPSYSTWFDMHTIHALEKKSLPEFFNSRNRSKTPAVYKDYRDFMINTYRLNPVEYLTVTACRRNLAGDVCAIMRVHAFLEQWGLINYQVDPQTRPANIGPPFTGHFRVTADTPRGLQPFQPAQNTFTTPGKPHPSTDRAASATPASKPDLNLELRRNVYDDKGKEVKKTEDSEKQTNGEGATANGASSGAATTKAMDAAAREPIKSFNCFSCGVDCTRCRFHYAKSDPVSSSANPNELKYDLCPNCYFQSRMPANHRSSDFVKMEEPAYSHIPDKDATWTDSETLLLLEGLENFDNDWNEIAKHVGSRTREECVLKFLQLDIQDQYLEDGPLNGASALKALTGRSAISQLDNPVMSVVSFLAQIADPDVVAAASNRSIAVMQKQLRAQLEKGMGGAEEKAAGEMEKAEVKSEDQMEVDESAPSAENPAPEANGSTKVINDIATTALAATAARASGLASHEEREITRMVSAAVNLTLQKFELKMAQFAEMEEIVQAERRDLEKGRQQLFLDRLSFKKRMKEMENTFRQASLKDPQEGMRMMQEAVSTNAGHKFGFQSEGDRSEGMVVNITADSGDARTMEL